MKYGYPTLFRQPVWVVLPHDKDVKFLIKPLSYSEMYGYNEIMYANKWSESYLHNSSFIFIHTHIIDFEGIIDCPSVKDALSMLSVQDKAFLEAKILEYSTLTIEQSQNLDLLIHLMLEPSLQEDTYNCEKCKAIPGMQAARNCPLLEVHPNNKFKLRVGNTTLTRCPISDMDIYVSNQIIKANGFMSMNILPIAGGIGDQSVWFVEIIGKYRAISYELSKTKG